MATKTTNYQLNLAAGSDLYNHLTMDNPNYTKIDQVMKANEGNSVPKATVTKASNTFGITRNPVTPVFWFVAGAAYTAGNTITVDGTTVTASLPDGSQLPTNAWRVNSNVLCVLNGTNLTVYSSAIDMGNYMPKSGGTFTGAITGTTITANTMGATTLNVNGKKVANIVVDEGDSGGWHWRKWSNGRAELSGKFNTTYSNTSVLGKSVAFPFSFDCDSATCGLNDSGGNVARALFWNAKVSIYGGSVSIWVHDAAAQFGSGDALMVSVHCTGNYV